MACVTVAASRLKSSGRRISPTLPAKVISSGVVISKEFVDAAESLMPANWMFPLAAMLLLSCCRTIGSVITISPVPPTKIVSDGVFSFRKIVEPFRAVRLPLPSMLIGCETVRLPAADNPKLLSLFTVIPSVVLPGGK